MLQHADAIATTAQIRTLEKAAGPGLMEHAGRAAAQHAKALIADSPHPVLILCGPGNNGGDGFTMARHLAAAHIAVTVVFNSDPAKLPADASAARAAYLDTGAHTVTGIPQGPWSLAVDALFGIGLTRPIEGEFAQWIEQFNALPCMKLALDIPSGLDADSGTARAPCVVATHTLSFIAMKTGLITQDGPDHCGQIAIDTLGLDVTPHTVGRINAPAQFAAQLIPRKQNTHKGCYGNAAIVGGAAGMTGALFLSARASVKLGAGRVFAAALDDAAPSVDVMQPEIMLRQPEEAIALADALAIGPGLGQSARALQLLREGIAREVPLVLDADALNLLAAHPVEAQRLRRRKAPAILTPHPLEAARLLACTAAEVQADRRKAALLLAHKFNAAIVLKGCGSVIAEGENWWINRTGNPGMASAGMGDVLTGLITALLAQSWPASAALRAAVFIHGEAAEDCAKNGIGPIGLCASDTLDAARFALNRLIVQQGRA